MVKAFGQPGFIAPWVNNAHRSPRLDFIYPGDPRYPSSPDKPPIPTTTLTDLGKTGIGLDRQILSELDSADAADQVGKPPTPEIHPIMGESPPHPDPAH